MAQSDKSREFGFLHDHPVLWYFAPWRCRGSRKWLFFGFLGGVVVVPVLAAWLLGPFTPIEILHPCASMRKGRNGLYVYIGTVRGVPVLNTWAWRCVLPGLSFVTWLFIIGAVRLLRLNLLQVGILEGVYLTRLDRRRAAIGTVAWGAAAGLAMILAVFLFQALYTGLLYPVRLGILWHDPQIFSVFGRTNGGGGTHLQEVIPFGVSHAFMMLAASFAVWAQAVRGALRQDSNSWFEALRCLGAGVLVVAILLGGMGLLDLLPSNYGEHSVRYFSFTLTILSAGVLIVMVISFVLSIRNSAASLYFGPVNRELFVREDWWEAELFFRRGDDLPDRMSPPQFAKLFLVHLAGVSLALAIVSLALQNAGLEELHESMVVFAIMGLYAPCAVAVLTTISRRPMEFAPTRGRLIRYALMASLPMTFAVIGALMVFLVTMSNFNFEGLLRRLWYRPEWILLPAVFGVGFGVLAHLALIPQRGRLAVLAVALAIGCIVLTTGVSIGGIALFGIGLAALCSLPSGLMSVLFQRIHDDILVEENKAIVELDHNSVPADAAASASSSDAPSAGIDRKEPSHVSTNS